MAALHVGVYEFDLRAGVVAKLALDVFEFEMNLEKGYPTHPTELTRLLGPINRWH